MSARLWRSMECLVLALGLFGCVFGTQLRQHSITVSPKMLPQEQLFVGINVSLSEEDDVAAGRNIQFLSLQWQGDDTWPVPSPLTMVTDSGSSAYFHGLLAGPSDVGIFRLAWNVDVTYDDGTSVSLSPQVFTHVEVTCSNGLFCDGEERWVNGRCVRGQPPCDDHSPCTDDICYEGRNVCEYIPQPAADGSCCPACLGDNHCLATADSGMMCVDDECGASSSRNPFRLSSSGEQVPLFSLRQYEVEKPITEIKSVKDTKQNHFVAASASPASSVSTSPSFSTQADTSSSSSDGTTQVFDLTCNTLQPRCQEDCGAKKMYCASDCQCHSVHEDLPDLWVDPDRLRRDLRIEWRHFQNVATDDDDASDDDDGEGVCAIREKCLNVPDGWEGGWRRLMRFSVQIVNQGRADVIVPNPQRRPELFQFSPCHHHFHFLNFTDYELLSVDTQRGTEKLIQRGRKQAFCLLDNERIMESPTTPCRAQFNMCAKRGGLGGQGISVGWSDVYGANLDCQWLDITGVPAGQYRLRVTVNRGRAILESAYDNNVAFIDVNVPPTNFQG